jgi:hypothetical protein
MPSLPPVALADLMEEIDTLPDGDPVLGAVITDEDIDASASDAPGAVFAQLPTRRPTRSFEEEPTRKQHAPKAAKTVESDDVVEDDGVALSSWDTSFANKKKIDEN